MARGGWMKTIKEENIMLKKKVEELEAKNVGVVPTAVPYEVGTDGIVDFSQGICKGSTDEAAQLKCLLDNTEDTAACFEEKIEELMAEVNTLKAIIEVKDVFIKQLQEATPKVEYVHDMVKQIDIDKIRQIFIKVCNRDFGTELWTKIREMYNS